MTDESRRVLRPLKKKTADQAAKAPSHDIPDGSAGVETATPAVPKVKSGNAYPLTVSLFFICLAIGITLCLFGLSESRFWRNVGLLSPVLATIAYPILGIIFKIPARPALRERFAAARKDGCRLRFIARLENIRDGKGDARVGLEALPEDHPLAGGAGTDNKVAIWSDRYREQPLVIQGPGAGAEVTAAGLLDDVLRIAAGEEQRVEIRYVPMGEVASESIFAQRYALMVTLQPHEVSFIPDALHALFDMGNAYPLITGIGLILTAILNPSGIAGETRHQVEWVKRKLAGFGRKDGPPPAEPAAPVVRPASSAL